MSNATYITQPERSMSLPQSNNPEIPQELSIDDLENVSLRNLRDKKNQTDKAIEVLCVSIRQFKQE
jgi:hypothetical protein